MTRLPKKRGITQDGEDKSLILRYSEKAVALNGRRSTMECSPGENVKRRLIA